MRCCEIIAMIFLGVSELLIQFSELQNKLEMVEEMTITNKLHTHSRTHWQSVLVHWCRPVALAVFCNVITVCVSYTVHSRNALIIPTLVVGHKVRSLKLILGFLWIVSRNGSWRCGFWFYLTPQVYLEKSSKFNASRSLISHSLAQGKVSNHLHLRQIR